jgi:hypothetical protein
MPWAARNKVYRAIGLPKIRFEAQREFSVSDLQLRRRDPGNAAARVVAGG